MDPVLIATIAAAAGAISGIVVGLLTFVVAFRNSTTTASTELQKQLQDTIEQQDKKIDAQDTKLITQETRADAFHVELMHQREEKQKVHEQIGALRSETDQQIRQYETQVRVSEEKNQRLIISNQALVARNQILENSLSLMRTAVDQLVKLVHDREDQAVASQLITILQPLSDT